MTDRQAFTPAFLFPALPVKKMDAHQMSISKPICLLILASVHSFPLSHCVFSATVRPSHLQPLPVCFRRFFFTSVFLIITWRARAMARALYDAVMQLNALCFAADLCISNRLPIDQCFCDLSCGIVKR